MFGLPPWDGRILVDATNQFARVDPIEVANLGEQTGSEFVVNHAPGAYVIRAFNTLFAGYMAPDPSHPAGQPVPFCAGDDAEAKPASSRCSTMSDSLRSTSAGYATAAS